MVSVKASKVLLLLLIEKCVSSPLFSSGGDIQPAIYEKYSVRVCVPLAAICDPV